MLHPARLVRLLDRVLDRRLCGVCGTGHCELGRTLLGLLEHLLQKGKNQQSRRMGKGWAVCHRESIE